jgi:hypothetical protein
MQGKAAKRFVKGAFPNSRLSAEAIATALFSLIYSQGDGDDQR